MRHLTILLGLFQLVGSASAPHDQQESCCGPCVCVACEEQLSTFETAKLHMDRAAMLFEGIVVAEERIPCCESRAAVTFKVIRRWKGPEEPQVVVWTRPCTKAYPFVVGRRYFVSADSRARGPAELGFCHPPLEGPGAQAIMEEFDKWRDADKKRYREGLQQLLWGAARGDVEWLQIAVRLRAASNAEASEQMDLAVGEALERQPANVFKIAVPGFDLEAVCGAPDVDDARYDSFGLSMGAIDRRIAKVAEITETSLVAIRDECLTELEHSRKGIASFYGRRVEDRP